MISLPEIVCLALASYRGTQLAVHDSVLDAPRGWAYDWHSDKSDSPFRAALVTLIGCIYCSGWWVSGAFLATYLLANGQWHNAPLLVHGVEWFAVAGGQALLNRWDDNLGHGDA